MDTSHHTQGSTSSEPAASSERFEGIIALGEKIVRELSAGDTNDVLSRWMAHYVAEQIEDIKTGSGMDRENKRRECCDLILELWRHRNDLPQGKRPFEDFEPVLRSLAALAPSASPRIYYRSLWLAESEKNVLVGSPDWLRIVSQIDSATTAIISYCVKMATHAAVDKSREWIHAADEAGVVQGQDIEAVRKLLEIDIDFVSADRKSPTREERLLERLDVLDRIYKELRTLATPASTRDVNMAGQTDLE